MDKVHGIPGNARHGEPESPREKVRKDQWKSGWKSLNETISFTQGLGHLTHTVEAIESQELKAHLKTTGILFRGVQCEFTKINEQVGKVREHVDSSFGGMITKTQAATSLSNHTALMQSQVLLSTKMEAMESKLELLISCLLDDDAKKGEKVLETKCGPELKSFSEDREGGGSGRSSGKEKVVETATVHLAGTVAGSSQAGGSSSGQGQSSKQILMDTTLMLNPDTISKRFTQEIEIGGITERVFYRDPILQQADEEMAKLLNLEINPDFDLEESIAEQRRLEKKKIPKVPRGKGRGRGRGRTQPKPRPIEKGISIRAPTVEESKSASEVQTSEIKDKKGKGILLEEPKKSKSLSLAKIL